MSTFGIILLVIVGAITLFEVSSFIFTIVKKNKEKKKLKEEVVNDDRNCDSNCNN